MNALPAISSLSQWQNCSVLVVDDSQSNRLMAVGALQDLGFTQIREACNGVQALELLDQQDADLVLTDLNMPQMDGVELLNHLAKRQQGKTIFVAVISSVDQSVLETIKNIADVSHLMLIGAFQKHITSAQLGSALVQHDPSRAVSEVHSWVRQRFTAEQVEAALDAGQLQPFFQPKVYVSDRRPCGMEALVRWIHPEFGVLPPVAFIEHLESGALAMKFYLRFLGDVCQFLSSLPPSSEPDAPHLHCSVNLPVPLLSGPSIVDDMVRIVADHHLTNQAIVLELTEKSIMLHLAESLSALARLRMKGFGVAMDDYGTGYSSLKQLARCPFNELKIDREFVHEVTQNDKKQAILNTAIALCQKLNLVPVAEGVELQSDWDHLVDLGCEVVQGYLISRPLPAQAMREWLLAHH